jgi:ribosomal protein S27AE
MSNSTPKKCPQCGADLSPVMTTASGKKLRRCSTSQWDPNTKQSSGCNYVLWLDDKTKELKELCPKCCGNVIQTTTKSGKKLKKCLNGKWDKEQGVVVGCDFVEWLDNKPKTLKELCPKCSAPLVLTKTASGKKLKKCSTAGWDRDEHVAIGCTFVEWLS